MVGWGGSVSPRSPVGGEGCLWGGRAVGVALALPRGGRRWRWRGGGCPPGEALLLTRTPPRLVSLPPQEPESPEASQFRLAAGRVPEVPFGISTSPAVLSHYGVAANTVTLFRRVRGPAAWERRGGGGWGGGRTEWVGHPTAPPLPWPEEAGKVRGAAVEHIPCPGNTMPCKKVVSTNLTFRGFPARWFLVREAPGQALKNCPPPRHRRNEISGQ